MSRCREGGDNANTTACTTLELRSEMAKLLRVDPTLSTGNEADQRVGGSPDVLHPEGGVLEATLRCELGRKEGESSPGLPYAGMDDATNELLSCVSVDDDSGGLSFPERQRDDRVVTPPTYATESTAVQGVLDIEKESRSSGRTLTAEKGLTRVGSDRPSDDQDIRMETVDGDCNDLERNNDRDIRVGLSCGAHLHTVVMVSGWGAADMHTLLQVRMVPHKRSIRGRS